MNSARALTLIELLVVLALLGLMASLVSVRMLSSTAHARLHAAHVIVEQTLRQAQFEATSRHATRLLQFERDPARVRIAEPGDAVRVWRLLEGVKITELRVGWGADQRTQSVDAIRLTPAGVSAAWTIDIASGGAATSLGCDGITPRLLPQPERGAP